MHSNLVDRREDMIRLSRAQIRFGTKPPCDVNSMLSSRGLTAQPKKIVSKMEILEQELQ